jgi:hypothetical protein
MDRTATLLALLADETGLCADLTHVLRAEQRALVALRPDAITACLAEREVLGEALGHLAGRRRVLVRELIRAHGGDGDALATLLGLASPATQATLRPAVRALRRALLVARGLERQNALVARASLETTHETLRALAALGPGTRYGADARLATPASERLGRRA